MHIYGDVHIRWPMFYIIIPMYVTSYFYILVLGVKLLICNYLVAFSRCHLFDYYVLFDYCVYYIAANTH